MLLTSCELKLSDLWFKIELILPSACFNPLQSSAYTSILQYGFSNAIWFLSKVFE